MNIPLRKLGKIGWQGSKKLVWGGPREERGIMEGSPMLPTLEVKPLSAVDQEIFEKLIRRDHYLRLAEEAIDFDAFRPLIAKHYKY